MLAGLGFIVQAILGMMGSQSLLHVGALSVRLSEGFLVLMAVCSVRSSCVLYLVVVSMVVLSQAILCPVVREWWAGADWLWEKSSVTPSFFICYSFNFHPISKNKVL